MSTIRARILDAAARLYRGGGLAALSTDALAREAAVSKRALYEHFDGRDAIVEALLAARLDRLHAELDAVVAAELPVRVKIRRFAERVALVPAEFPPGFFVELRRLAPAVAEGVKARRAGAAREVLARLLSAGVATGEVRGDVPVPLLVAVAEVMMDNMLLVEPPAGHGPLDVAQAALAVLLDGVLTPGGADVG